MIDLTVGYVAGMVAAGFFIASQIAPNALAFILSWRLRDKSTAATWSVAASAFQQSHWSWFVFGDTTYSNGVSSSVLWASRLIPLTATLLAIGSVVTPLGLYSAMVTSESVVGQFAYAFDTSAYGYGTPERRNYTFARTCGSSAPKPCPFSDSVSIMSKFPNGTTSWDYPYGINVNIPDFIRKAYSSGTSNSSTVSNYFDINWRRFSTTRNRFYMNGSSFFVGDYRNIENMVLNNGYDAVEGLVVDTVNGGVGLRNHTAPAGFAHGVEWEEDLLFIEPESVCVDTNTTLDFTIKAENGSLIPNGNVLLTDRGGFVNLNKTYPRVNITDKQDDIELYMRAYKGAWLLNAYTALYFNVTNPANESAGIKAWSYLNSEMNKTFDIAVATSGDGVTNLESYGLSSLSLSQTFGEYVKGALDPNNPTSKQNPWGVSKSNFSDISILCSGMGNGDYANITNLLIGCGQLRGVPQRVSPGHPSSLDDGSSWSQKIYVCATAVKANVKTVSFSYNGTDGSLEALNVTGVRDKTYASDADLPLWGVEDTGNAYNLTELQLIWGLVSDEYAKHRNVSTVRQRSLYLPGFMDPTNTGLGAIFGNWENLPGSDFAVGAVAAAYSVSTTSGVSVGKGQDYTGINNLAIWSRWQNLTRDAESAALIPKLIFTDTAASTIVGTKGALGPSNAGVPGNYPEILVIPSKQAVRFHLPYAIPAFLAAFLLLLILSVTLAAVIFGSNGYSRMRRHLQQTSSGRVYSTFLYPDPGVLRMPSKEWSEKFGDKAVDLSGDYPAAQDVLVPSTDEKDHGIVTSEQPIYQQQYDSPQVHHSGLEQQQASPYYQNYQGYEGYHSGYTGMQSLGYEEPKNVAYHPGLPANEQQVYQDITQSPQSPEQHFPKAY